MARQGIGRGLAMKIFSLQKRGGNFSADVMRSARLCVQGVGTKNDIEKLRGALGIARSGAAVAQRELRGISNVVNRAGQYGVLASTAAQGGLTGFAAAGSLVNNALQDADKIVKSKAFQDLIENAAQKYLGNAATGARAGYALRRGFRIARAGLAYAQAGGAIAVGGIRGVEEFTGLTQSDRARVTQSDARLAESNSRASLNERAIAVQRAMNERGLVRKFREEGVGGLWNSFLNTDKKKLSEMELRQSARDAGFAGADQIRSLARDRLYKEKFGEFIGRQARGIDNKIGRELTIDPLEVSKKAQEMIARAIQMRGDIDNAMKIGDVKYANKLIDEAEMEIPGQVWRRPGEIWKMQESARAAARLWPTQNMSRANSRTGE